MKNILLRYMIERFDKNVKLNKEPGPVLTISREFGCPSRLVAGFVYDEITKRTPPGKNQPQWKCLNKEIIEAAARELDMNPEKVEEYFNAEQKNMIHEIISALLEQNFKSDMKIRKTISEVIRSFSREGHVIIIGRGGVALTQNIPLAFHVKLMASLEWRIKMTAKKYNLKKENAHKMVLETDKKRQNLIDDLTGRKSGLELFHLIINCEKATPHEAGSIIASVMEMKGLLRN